MSHTIADPSAGPFELLEWNDPIAIAFYPEHSTKTDFIETVSVFAVPREVLVVRNAEEAWTGAQEDALFIIDPSDEAEAVRFLDRNRDWFEGAPARILLLLLRGGEGQRQLGEAPALASFCRESSFDLTSPPTLAERRASFLARWGCEPEKWIDRWRAGELADDTDNNFARVEAAALVTGQ